MEAGECGLTRGAYVVARRLEVVAVARVAVKFVVCFGCGGFFRVSFFFERIRPAASMMRLASFTSLLVMMKGREREATKDIFCL